MSGSWNTCIGADAGADLTTELNVTIIGDGIRRAESGETVFGTTVYGKPIDPAELSKGLEAWLAVLRAIHGVSERP